MTDEQLYCTVRNTRVNDITPLFAGAVVNCATAMFNDCKNAVGMVRSYTVNIGGNITGVVINLAIPVVYITRHGEMFGVIDYNGVQCQNATHEEFAVIVAVHEAFKGL